MIPKKKPVEEINQEIEQQLGIMRASAKAIGKMFDMNLNDGAIYDRTDVEWMYNGSQLYLDVYEDLHGYDANEIVAVHFVLNAGDYALIRATEDVDRARFGHWDCMKYFLVKRDGEVKQ